MAIRQVADSVVTRLLATDAYRVGEEFILSAGGVSNEYLDVRTVAHRPGTLMWLAERIDCLGLEYDVIAGVAQGGVPLAFGLALYRRHFVGGVALPVLTVRAAGKEHGTKSGVDGVDNLRGCDKVKILLLEDVLTTGASVIRALDVLAANPVLKECGAVVTAVVAVADRGGIADVSAVMPPGADVVALTTLVAVRECSTRIAMSQRPPSLIG